MQLKDRKTGAIIIGIIWAAAAAISFYIIQPSVLLRLVIVFFPLLFLYYGLAFYSGLTSYAERQFEYLSHHGKPGLNIESFMMKTGLLFVTASFLTFLWALIFDNIRLVPFVAALAILVSISIWTHRVTVHKKKKRTHL